MAEVVFSGQKVIRGPLTAVSKAWLNAFACASITVPNFKYRLYRSKSDRYGACFWLWVTSASALNGIPMEIGLIAHLEVIAQAAAGSLIPEVIYSAISLETDALFGSFVPDKTRAAIERDLSDNASSVVVSDGALSKSLKTTAVNVLVLLNEGIWSVGEARLGLSFGWGLKREWFVLNCKLSVIKLSLLSFNSIHIRGEGTRQEGGNASSVGSHNVDFLFYNSQTIRLKYVG